MKFFGLCVHVYCVRGRESICAYLLFVVGIVADVDFVADYLSIIVSNQSNSNHVLYIYHHYIMQVVARCLVSKKFNEGEVIIKQGDVGDSFYLIAKGEVSVQVNHIQVRTNVSLHNYFIYLLLLCCYHAFIVLLLCVALLIVTLSIRAEFPRDLVFILCS